MAGLRGEIVGGTVTNPAETHGRILGLPKLEVEKLVGEIAEIKQLLMCRLLLSQAALLPAALRASSLEDFFSDPETSISELRDLCLKLEQPSLQEIRDACADFARGDIEDDGPDAPEKEDGDDHKAYDQAIAKRQEGGWMSREGMPDVWKSKHEEKIDKEAEQHRDQQRQDEGQLHADFGEIIDEASLKSRKVKIRVCGRC